MSKLHSLDDQVAHVVGKEYAHVYIVLVYMYIFVEEQNKNIGSMYHPMQ